VQVAGVRFRPFDISLGGFALDGYSGPLMPGDSFAGRVEPMTDPSREGVSFTAAVRRRDGGILGAEFTAMDDAAFDRLTGLMAGVHSFDNYVQELRESGGCPSHFLDALARLDHDVARTFSRDQLEALRLTFGRTVSAHQVALRLSLPVLWSRFYLVLLLGRERRTRTRLSAEGVYHGVGSPLAWLAQALGIAALLSPLLVALYLVKEMVGLDVFPDTGVHKVIEDLGRQLHLIFDPSAGRRG
jgi:hypothetical protein